MREHTSEFIELEKQIMAAADEFCADLRHIRFVESSDYNWVSLNNYIHQNDLDAPNPEHLHQAYEALTREQLLELLPLGHASVPQLEPAPVSTVQQPPLVAPAKARMFR